MQAISQDLTLFLSRTYFTRRWVLQGIFCSTDTETQVMCGSATITWRELKLAAEQASWPVDTQAYGDNPPRRVIFGSAPFRVGASTFYASVSTAMVVLERVELFKEAQCSDPKDKAYSLLNFHAGQSCMRPDYNLTTSQVWTKLALHAVREDFAGSTLNAVTRQMAQIYLLDERAVDLPSWVPDFGLRVSHSNIWYCKTWERPHTTSKVASTVDERDRLHCTLHCYGQVEFHNGWALLGQPTAAPESVMAACSQGSAVSDAAITPSEMRRSMVERPELFALLNTLPCLLRNTPLRQGDLVCTRYVENNRPDFVLGPSPGGVTLDEQQIYALIGYIDWMTGTTLSGGDLRRFVIS